MHLTVTLGSTGEGCTFWVGSSCEGYHADKGDREEAQGEDGLMRRERQRGQGGVSTGQGSNVIPFSQHIQSW